MLQLLLMNLIGTSRARVGPLFSLGRFDRIAEKFIDLFMTKKRLNIES